MDSDWQHLVKLAQPNSNLAGALRLQGADSTAAGCGCVWRFVASAAHLDTGPCHPNVCAKSVPDVMGGLHSC